MADNKPILFDQFGRPIEREVMTREIAGPSIAGVRSPLSGYPGDGLNPIRLASLMREADAGQPLRYLELAEQIEERDLHYAGVLATRKRSVSQLDIEVDAASDSSDDKAIADMVRDWLKRDELQDELFDILDAIGKGWSFTEIIWDTSGGQWRPAALKWRDPRWFRPAYEDGMTPLLRGDAGDTPLPPFKFIHAVIRAKSGLPLRSGLARLAAWSWMFKAYTLRDWAIFTQTFGQPIRIGKYQSGATEGDKDTLFKAVANIAGDCAAIIPEGMSIDFVEAKGKDASGDLYKARADWLDQQVSKGVLGQTATTDAIAGGHAVGQEHRQVQEDIERADARALSGIINRDLVRPWVDLERGPQKKYPRVRIGRPDAVDVKQTIEGVETLVPLGMQVPKKWANEILGVPLPKTGEEVLAAWASAPPFTEPPLAPDAPRPAARPSLHARDRQDDIDRLAGSASVVSRAGQDAMIDHVRHLVETSTSLQAVRDGLLQLVPTMPSQKLAEAMQLAMVMAELSGRADIIDAQ
jgi:phage gp29-like protein